MDMSSTVPGLLLPELDGGVGMFDQKRESRTNGYFSYRFTSGYLPFAFVVREEIVR